MLVLSLIISLLFVYLCYHFGVEKGYSGGLCLVAGIFGGLIAFIIILFLPDRTEEQYRADARSREISELRRRISELEAAQPKPAPKAELTVKEPAPTLEQDRREPALFPYRTDDPVTCPRCGKVQRGNRNLCLFCELPFLYEHE